MSPIRIATLGLAAPVVALSIATMGLLGSLPGESPVIAPITVVATSSAAAAIAQETYVAAVQSASCTVSDEASRAADAVLSSAGATATLGETAASLGAVEVSTTATAQELVSEAHQLGVSTSLDATDQSTTAALSSPTAEVLQ